MQGVRIDGSAVTARLRAALAHWLLPAPCLACESLATPLDRTFGLCPACRGRLRPVRGDRCRLCLRRLTGASSPRPPTVCGACAARPPALDATLAGWSFEAPLDVVIHALKFGRQPHLGRQLGRALAAAQPATVKAAELLVPVPLHWRRRLVRGYNQAAEIAAGLGLVTAVPVRRALARTRPTRPQAGLPFERRAGNVGRAFSVRDPGAVRDRRCLLVDDVVTTGATLEQAARALRRAGARSVVALAAARTPRLRFPGPE